MDTITNTKPQSENREVKISKEFYPVTLLAAAYICMMTALIIALFPGAKNPEKQPKKEKMEIIAKTSQAQIVAPKGKTEQPPEKKAVKPENKAIMNAEDRFKYRRFMRNGSPLAKPDSGAMKQQRILRY